MDEVCSVNRKTGHTFCSVLAKLCWQYALSKCDNATSLSNCKAVAGMKSDSEKFLLMTGATSGIGLSLVEQLVANTNSKYHLHICLTCRNWQKGEQVRKKIQCLNPNVDTKLVKMDVESIQSVIEASEKIMTMYTRMDCLFLIAGIMPVSKLNFTFLLKKCLTLDCVEMFRTGDGVFETFNRTTNEGIKSIFATNVLGHFILVQKMIPLLSKSKTASKVIWTTSTNAARKAFDPDDVTCQYGTQPYASSKYIIDAMSFELNDRLNHKGIYSHVADPGTAITGLTARIIPTLLWYILVPIMWLFRVALPNLTIFPSTACQSMLWLLEQEPSQLCSKSKYCSCASVAGRAYVEKKPIPVSEDDSRAVFQLVQTVADEVTAEYSVPQT